MIDSKKLSLRSQTVGVRSKKTDALHSDERIKSFYCVMPDIEQTITDFQKKSQLGVAFKAVDNS